MALLGGWLTLLLVGPKALAQGPAPQPAGSASASASASTSALPPISPFAQPPSASAPPPTSAGPSQPPAPLSPLRTEPAACEPCVPLVVHRPEVDGEEGQGQLRYVLQAIQIQGNTRTSERVIRRYVKLHAGDILDIENPELELMRFRMLATGYFRTVNLSLRKGSRRGQVVLVIEVTERNTIVLSGLWMGLSADADTRGNARPLTAYGGADVAETNLGGTGVTLGAGLGFALDQLALRTRFFDPAFVGTQWMTSATLLYNDARDFYGTRDVKYDDPNNATALVHDYAIAHYKRFGGTLGVGHDLSSATQLWLDYRLERLDASLPLAASHRRGLDTEPIDFGLNRGLSVLSTLRGTLVYDTRDTPLLPSRGSHLTLTGDVALAPFGSNYHYQKLTLSASKWFALPWRHVVRVRGFGGLISGYAPIYERFYVGDFSDFLPKRMFDLNTDRRPVPNFLGTDIVEVRYGQYAAELQGEYRIPLYRGSRSVYGIDLFGSGGIYGVATERDLTDPPRGYSTWSRVPVDLTFNLGLLIDTSAGGFSFALSNVIGFLPVRSSAEP